jgi:hypothetical protein
MNSGKQKRELVASVKSGILKENCDLYSDRAVIEEIINCNSE